MNQGLLVSVRFHDGRYHGERRSGAGEWPPTPARLFQALVAGASCGQVLDEEAAPALRWLESLGPPVIAVPPARLGQPYTSFVPNNDRDQVEGGTKSINEIRTPKTMRPHIFDAEIPLLFAWTFEQGTDEGKARAICNVTQRLYQLGRGVDMAWAWGEILSVEEMEMRLTQHGGAVHRPGERGAGDGVLCPKNGSLASLRSRYDQPRLTHSLIGRRASQTFSRPSPPRFGKVLYDVSSRHLLFELRAGTRAEPFAPWPATRVAELVVNLRDKAADRLKHQPDAEIGKIRQVFVGREATETDKAARVRILPLLSIGHVHADRAIRRVLVEVPPGCPIHTDDISSAFSGLSQLDQATGEIKWNLVKSDQRRLLDHYGVGDSDASNVRVWRTVTPAALPIMRPRRDATGTTSSKRVANEAEAAFAVVQALRHGGVTKSIESIRVQREPFEAKGFRAEEFVVPGRFAARELYHVEIRLTRPVKAPLVIGNGRYLGLGLMAPATRFDDVVAFNLDSERRIAPHDRPVLVRSLRRALMALARDGAGHVDRLFSGHESDGRSDSAGHHAHVFLAVDGGANHEEAITRLVVAAPWAVDHRVKSRRDDQRLFDKVTRQLGELRAGRLGRFDRLMAEPVEDGDPLLGPATTWISKTSYVATRNLRKHDDPAVAVKVDVATECVRRGLPIPTEIHVSDVSVGPRGGRPAAKLKLRFAAVVRGPLLLGRDSHAGGGLLHVAPLQL